MFIAILFGSWYLAVQSWFTQFNVYGLPCATCLGKYRRSVSHVRGVARGVARAVLPVSLPVYEWSKDRSVRSGRIRRSLGEVEGEPIRDWMWI